MFIVSHGDIILKCQMSARRTLQYVNEIRYALDLNKQTNMRMEKWKKKLA